MSEASDTVVEIEGLSRQFRRAEALRGIDLSIPRGTVFGLVGENGAGKTTLIKHILGLLRPHAGSVRVFGLDPVTSPELVLARIGYLSEERDLPGWMRVRDLTRYMRAFYPDWDDDYARELLRLFELDPGAKLKHLSRGQLAKAGLLAALAYRPELLVLDEPSSGLDPIVRRDILTAIIRTVAEEGRTVLFSSHLLGEVERVADEVAMIHRGTLVLRAPVDELKSRYRRLVLHFDGGMDHRPTIPGALSCQGRGREWTIIFEGSEEAAQAAANGTGGEVVEASSASLEDIFIAQAGRKAEG